MERELRAGSLIYIGHMILGGEGANKGQDRTFDAEKRRKLKVHVRSTLYIRNVRMFSTEYICYIERGLVAPRRLINNLVRYRWF